MRERVEKLLNNALDKDKSLFLIDFRISSGNQIHIILDGDHGVSVKDCIAVSREIEHNLDREEHEFSLEVASAGVSEPLTKLRQYKKNVGRKLNVRTLNGVDFEGVLETADQDEIKLQWKVREPKSIGKGKVTVKKEAVIDYKDIAEAKVMITFN